MIPLSVNMLFPGNDLNCVCIFYVNWYQLVLLLEMKTISEVTVTVAISSFLLTIALIACSLQWVLFLVGEESYQFSRSQSQPTYSVFQVSHVCLFCQLVILFKGMNHINFDNGETKVKVTVGLNHFQVITLVQYVASLLLCLH